MATAQSFEAPAIALAEHVTAIRQLGKRVVADVAEIGRRLFECKRICGHGNWLPWLEREFGWTEKTAERFMSVHALAGKSDNLSNLNLPISGLYLLAAPSTPKSARDAIIERAQSGEPVSVAEVKQTTDAAKGRKQPAKKGWSRERYKRHRAKKRQARERKRQADTWNAIVAGAKPRVEALSARLVETDASLARDVLSAVATFGPCGMADGAASPTSHLFIFALDEALAARKEAPPPTSAPELEMPARAQQDVGPQSTGEVERLRARVDELQAEKRQLEIKITGLKSENAELKAENVELRAKLEPAGASQQRPSTNGKGKEENGAGGNDALASAGKRKAAYALDDGSDPGPIPECLRRGAS